MKKTKAKEALAARAVRLGRWRDAVDPVLTVACDFAAAWDLSPSSKTVEVQSQRLTDAVNRWRAAGVPDERASVEAPAAPLSRRPPAGQGKGK